MTVSERFKQVVSEQMGLSISEIHESSRFVDDFGCDSLDAIEIAIAVEIEFETEIKDEDSTEQIDTFGEAVKYLEEHLR